MANGNALRVLRQFTLAVVAIALLGGTQLARSRTTSWEVTLWVTVYPVLVGEEAATALHVDGLTSESFAYLEKYYAREAAS